MLMRIVAIIAGTVLLTLFGSVPAATATITVLPANSQGENIIVIEGDFEVGDYAQFQNKTDAVIKAIVAFDSRGGAADTGKIIGEIIRRKKYATFVAPNARCASACAIAWLGGSDRYMCSTARIGFHSVLSL